MKPGSIVVVKSLNTLKNHIAFVMGLIKWLPVDDETTPYMIRGILEDPRVPGVMGVTFEEGILGFLPPASQLAGMEIRLHISFVREIQPPQEIILSDLIEEPELVTAWHDIL